MKTSIWESYFAINLVRRFSLTATVDHERFTTGVAHSGQNWMALMQKLYFQMICPFWAMFESCVEMLIRDASPAMRFDAMMSRTIHALNRSRFAQAGQSPYPSAFCTDEHVGPVYFQHKAENRCAVDRPKEHE
jgi:hypothetical protein